MATNIKVLASVSITNVVGSLQTLYAPGGTKSALVTSIAFFNTHASVAPDVFLGTRNSVLTTNQAIFHKVSALAPGAAVGMTDVVSLRGTDSESIVGYLSTAGTVNCVVFGIERD